MKQIGRPSKFTKEQQWEIAEKYLHTNLSSEEIGEQYGITQTAVLYYAKKLQKGKYNAESHN